MASPRKFTRPSVPADDSIEQAALRYLARQDRSQAQLRTYLSRLGASPERIHRVITGFLRRGYLNDEVYALRWAQSRLEHRPMGRSRLEAELLAQGFDPVTAATAVEQAYRGRDERDLALLLLRRRTSHRKAADQAHQARLLRRYGFGEDVIGQVLGESGSL
jgi:regulatory protein